MYGQVYLIEAIHIITFIFYGIIKDICVYYRGFIEDLSRVYRGFIQDFHNFTNIHWHKS